MESKPSWHHSWNHSVKPDSFSFKQNDAMTILIALHWVADGWKIYLFSRQLSLESNTREVPAKLRGRMSHEDYDFARRQSQMFSTATIFSVAILLLVKTFKLLLGYPLFIWELTMDQAETQFWRAVLYGMYDELFSKLIVLPFSVFGILMSLNLNSLKVPVSTVFMVTMVQIIVGITISAATMACLMIAIEFFGYNIFMYFAPISSAAAIFLMAIENAAFLQLLMKRLRNPNANAEPNAYFIEVLGTNVITITRSLINMLDPQQFAAMVAHELGHRSKDHHFIFMFLSVLKVSTLTIGMAYSYDNHILVEMFGFARDKPDAIITFFLWLEYFSPLISGLLNGTMSVLRRLCEFYADDLARDIGLGLYLKTSLLTIASKSTVYPIFDPLFSAWYHGHPTILERVERIESH